MARNTKSRGVVFGTRSMSPKYQQQNEVITNGGSPMQSPVATQFGASLSRTPIYLGRQKSMRR
jgi:hypothetical protein